jgi:hypothetical protein
MIMAIGTMNCSIALNKAPETVVSPKVRSGIFIELTADTIKPASISFIIPRINLLKNDFPIPPDSSLMLHPLSLKYFVNEYYRYSKVDGYLKKEYYERSEIILCTLSYGIECVGRAIVDLS